jgi:uncharacterized membrane protein required for colicin V production
LLSLINQLRWADLIVILIIGRSIYIGIKRGFAVEIFKLIGTLLCAFACLHFYSKLGAFLSKPKIILPDLGNFVAFLLIFAVFSGFSYLVREMFLFLMKLQPIPVLDKWGGAFLSGIRSVFLSGLVLLMFIISPVGLLDRGAKITFFGPYTYGAVAKTYTFTVEKIIKPFFTEENLNEEIFRALER